VFTELIDTLRCPAAHEDSWLVASSTRTEARHIIEGRLGCPVCRGSYPIVNGVAQFGAPVQAPQIEAFDDETAFRIAAQLHLIEAPSPILLTGRWSAAVEALLRITSTVRMFVGDSQLSISLDDRVSLVTLPPTRVPLATASLRGLALDADHATEALLSDAARVVRANGRLVAPVECGLDPLCWTPLVRDADVQVAERLPMPSAPVQIRRAPSNPLFTA
jgi:uncharacterized protein YbaR (Trm112 family)